MIRLFTASSIFLTKARRQFTICCYEIVRVIYNDECFAHEILLQILLIHFILSCVLVYYVTQGETDQEDQSPDPMIEKTDGTCHHQTGDQGSPRRSSRNIVLPSFMRIALRLAMEYRRMAKVAVLQLPESNPSMPVML